jgi:hypothetical protein
VSDVIKKEGEYTLLTVAAFSPAVALGCPDPPHLTKEKRAKVDERWKFKRRQTNRYLPWTAKRDHHVLIVIIVVVVIVVRCFVVVASCCVVIFVWWKWIPKPNQAQTCEY